MTCRALAQNIHASVLGDRSPPLKSRDREALRGEASAENMVTGKWVNTSLEGSWAGVLAPEPARESPVAGLCRPAGRNAAL